MCLYGKVEFGIVTNTIQYLFLNILYVLKLYKGTSETIGD